MWLSTMDNGGILLGFSERCVILNYWSVLKAKPKGLDSTVGSRLLGKSLGSTGRHARPTMMTRPA